MSVYTFNVNLLKYRLQTTRKILSNLLYSQNYERKNVINKIMTIKRIYSLISDSVLLINGSLGLPLMFLFGTILLFLIKHLYLLFLDLEDDSFNLNFGK